MNDPRLNSIHLEPPRRKEFRAARDQLLQGCGEKTLNGQAAESKDDLAADKTAFQPDGKGEAVIADFVLLDREKVYPLKVGLNTIGRLPDNDVVLDDAYVSRRHCAVLVHADGRCELHDVASKNGTLLNGEKIPGPTPLKPTDQIRMCTKNLVFMAREDQGGGDATQHTQAD